MNTQCPQCKKEVTTRGSIFSFSTIECAQCKTLLRTSLKSRLLFLSAFVALALHYAYVKFAGQDANQILVWAGLVIIIAPMVLSIKTSRLEPGNQKDLPSVAVNAVFYTVIVLLMYLWLGV